MKKTFYLILFCTSTLFAQIDTTDWYPLHVGDKWEYYNPQYGFNDVNIIGDTIMNNGKEYFNFGESGVYSWRYQRFDGKSKVYYFSTSDENEYLLFDFNVSDKTIWENNFDSYLWGIEYTWTDNNNLMGVPLENKIFNRVRINTTVDPPDTIWNPTIDSYPTLVTRQLGITSYLYGMQELVGAYINGVGYGTLVKVDEEELGTPNEFRLSQNYPNPFNPSTTIEYTIPNVETLRATSQMQNVTLKVFDILGREVAELVNEQKPAGRYRVNFNGAALSSGVYIYQLSAGTQLISRKMMLIK